MENAATNEPSADSSSLFANTWVFAGSLVLLIGFTFPAVILGTESFVLRDFGLFGYPLAHHHKASLLSGEIPLWNPYNYCGVPFLAQWNTMVLYPGSLIYVLFPLPWSLGIFVLAHQFLGGLGMYRLLKSWHKTTALAAAVGAVAYAFGGLFQNCLMWPNNAAALGLLPWVLLLANEALQSGGRSIPIVILVGAAQMLTGAPEMILVTWTIVFILGVSLTFAKPTAIRSTLIRFGIIVAGVALLASPQLLPFFDLLSHSLRATYEMSDNQWPADPLFWANMIVPTTAVEHYGSGLRFLRGQQWTHSYYTGVFILLLGLYALCRGTDLRHRFLGFLALISCVLALGNHGHLYPLLDRFLPLGILRYPVKFLVFPLVILPILAADAIPRIAAKNRKSAWLVSASLILAMAVVAFGIIGWSGGSPEFQWRTWLNGIMRFVFLGLGLFTLWLLTKQLPLKMRCLSHGALVLIVWADLITHQPVLTPSVLTDLFRLENETLKAIKPPPAPGGARMLMSHQAREYNSQMSDDSLEQMFIEGRMSLAGNLNLSEGVPKFGGFFSLWFPKFAEVEQHIYRGENEIDERLADFLGIGYVTKTDTLNEWQPRPTAQPWVTIGRQPRFENDRELDRRRALGLFNPARDVYFDPARKQSLPVSADPSATVEDLQFGNHQITFRTRSTNTVAVVIAQFHYHPWKATIDGLPAPIIPSATGFQALAVPPGKHVVELRYQDNRFRLGIVLSFLTLVACGWHYFRWKPAADASKS